MEDQRPDISKQSYHNVKFYNSRSGKKEFKSLKSQNAIANNNGAPKKSAPKTYGRSIIRTLSCRGPGQLTENRLCGRHKLVNFGNYQHVICTRLATNNKSDPSHLKNVKVNARSNTRITKLGMKRKLLRRNIKSDAQSTTIKQKNIFQGLIKSESSSELSCRFELRCSMFPHISDNSNSEYKIYRGKILRKKLNVNIEMKNRGNIYGTFCLRSPQKYQKALYCLKNHIKRELCKEGSSESDTINVLISMSERELCEYTALLPPITRFLLRRLNSSKLFSDDQLRHDLLFDKILQLVPDQESCGWDLIVASPNDVDLRQERSVRGHVGVCYWMLLRELKNHEDIILVFSLVLNELKAILLGFHPQVQSYKMAIEQVLDIRYIAQQIKHQVIDICGLAKKICAILKANCASTKYKYIDKLSEASSREDCVTILKECFDLALSIKIDRENCYIVHLRRLKLHSGLRSEWSRFIRNFFGGSEENFHKRDIEAKRWILKETKEHPSTTSPKLIHALAVIKLIYTLSKSKILDKNYPETLSLDMTRIFKLSRSWRLIGTISVFLFLARALLQKHFNERTFSKFKMEVISAFKEYDCDEELPGLSKRICEVYYKHVRDSLLSKDSYFKLSPEFVERSLRCDSMLSKSIDKHILKLITIFIENQEKITHFTLKSMGIYDSRELIYELVCEALVLISYNWTTYIHYYMSTIEHFRCTPCARFPALKGSNSNMLVNFVLTNEGQNKKFKGTS